MKKIISVITAFVLLLGLVSCSSEIKAEDSRTVLTLDGKKVNYDYFRYVYMNTKADFDNGDKDYWESNPEKEAELKEAVLDSLLQNRAIELLAKKYGISLTKDEKKEIEKYIKALKDSDPNYKDSMKDAYMTDYVLNYVQSFTQLWSKTYDYVTAEKSGIIKSDDSTVKADIPINSRAIRYILIEFEPENKDGKLNEINEAQARAQQGEDFVSLVKEYCEDSNMVSVAKDGYYYTKTQLVSEIEDEVEKLEVGEISSVLELSMGFFIIQRIDIDEKYVEDNFEDFVIQYKARLFNEMLDEIRKDIKVEYTDIWENASVSTVK